MITISQILQLQFDEFFSFLLFRYFLLDFSCFMQESLLNKKKKLTLRSKLGILFALKLNLFLFVLCYIELNFMMRYLFFSGLCKFINGCIRECLFQMRQFLESFFSQHLLIHFHITHGLPSLMMRK